MILQGDEFAGRRANFVHTTISVISDEFKRYKDTSQVLNNLLQLHNMADLPDKSNYLIEKTKLKLKIMLKA